MTRYLLLLAVVLAVFVPACGGGEDEADEPQKVGESGGLTTYEVERAGFSIGVPPDWRTMSSDEVFTEEDIREMAEEDPELASFFEAFDRPDSPMRFLAFDPDVEDEFATNANVIVEPVPGDVTREQYFEATMSQLRQAFGDVEEQSVELPAGEALEVAYEQSREAGTVATLQYILFEDGSGYVLTYTTLPGQVGKRAEDFDRSARSFRIL